MKLATFFEKFDQFADAPDAVTKMRELILHLAVTGTLVAQDHNDEPALALLDRIAAHKRPLAKEGKLRGPTTVSPMPQDEGTRVLPSSWTWVRFGEIMVNRDGERIPVSKEERSTKAKTYDYYGASGVIDKIDRYLFDKPLLLIGEDGANLINRSTPIAFMARGKYWVNNHAHVLDGISEEFLRYIELHINAINLEPYVTGSAQPKMNQAKMNSIPIALPPLAEQKRIIAKVDELMALCDRLEKQQQEGQMRHAGLARASLARFAKAPTPANLNFLFHKSYTVTPSDLRKSILRLAVKGELIPQDANDEPAAALLRRIGPLKKPSRYEKRSTDIIPGDCGLSIGNPRTSLPNGWLWVPLVEIAQIESGHTPSRNRPDWWGGEISWMGLVDARIHHGGTIFETIQHTNEQGIANSAARILPVGTVCFSRTASVGYVVLLGKPMATSQDFVNWVPTEAIDSQWLQLVLIAEKPVLNRFSKGAVHQTIYYPAWLSMFIALPSLAEQRRIVAKVDQLMSLVDQLDTHLAASRTAAAKLMEALVVELTAFR